MPRTGDVADFAQALVALDAQVEVVGPDGHGSPPFAQLHTEPGQNPHVETSLTDELIRAFTIPAGAWTRRSTYAASQSPSSCYDDLRLERAREGAGPGIL